MIRYFMVLNCYKIYYKISYGILKILLMVRLVFVMLLLYLIVLVFFLSDGLEFIIGIDLGMMYMW